MPQTRRDFLAGTAVAAVTLPAATAALAKSTEQAAGGDFQFEIQRTEEEWRALLSKEEYYILRKGGTELPKSSPLWNETRAGGYACRGCELPVYISKWKAPIDKGWVFFSQSEPNSILMGIDGNNPYGKVPPAMIEAHCRRCGSHLGHILSVGTATLHCIDGAALLFTPDDTA